METAFRIAVTSSFIRSLFQRHLYSTIIIVFGLCVLYFPTFFDLFNGLWRTDQHGHGPIVLTVAVSVFINKLYTAHKEGFAVEPNPVQGWLTFLIGIALYALGRSQGILLFEVGSIVLVMLGLVLILLGRKWAQHQWFCFLFMIFVVPLPGTLVDAVTQPVKIAVSISAEYLLFLMGFPVARSGVILMIGKYQLLVADACAGLNSLFTLEALGLLYVNITRNESALRNAMLAIMIIPISFASNVSRVLILALITYYFGDVAGQGFLHKFSGMALFLIALIMIISADTLIKNGAIVSGTFYKKNRPDDIKSEKKNG